MKKLLLVALVAASFSGLANANNGIYTSVKAGVSDTKLKNNEVVNTISEEHLYQNNQTKSIYPSLSAAVGYDFGTISPVNARVELEYNYKDSSTFNAKTNSINGAPDDRNWITNKVKSQSLMLNSYYDFKNTSKFTPYVSAGVGMTRIKNSFSDSVYEETNFSKSDNHFTWSAGVGVAYNITNNVALDASYRYVDAGKFKFNNNIATDESVNVKYKLSSNDYALGIRYNF